MEILGEFGSNVLGAAYTLRVPLAIGGALALLALLLVARRRGWAAVAARHPAATAVAGAGALLIGGPLAWYLVSPVFLRTELREPPPVAAAQPSGRAPATAVAPLPSVIPAAPAAPDPTATVPPDPTATPWTAAAPRTGRFRGTDDFHFGRGRAILLETSPGEWTVRLEDFSVRNGPDLYLYLSPDPDGYAPGAIEVARLKATDGSFNTRVPPGTDVSGVRSVLIWCRQFSHLFALAPLDG